MGREKEYGQNILYEKLKDLFLFACMFVMCMCACPHVCLHMCVGTQEGQKRALLDAYH